MKRTDELVSSFNRSWKRFSGTLKKARTDASEKSVHDLRVNTRRIIATLELARVLSNRGDIAKVQRRFKIEKASLRRGGFGTRARPLGEGPGTPECMLSNN